jgi:hypothetical protein
MDLRNTKNPGQLSEVELKLFSDGQSVDWYLQRLVSIANASELEVGITLVIGGSVVSGRLIGGRKYFEEFAREFSDAWPGDAKDRIRDAFARQGEIYSAGSEEDKAVPPQFIHLADARCFYPGSQLPNNSGVLWRGKINAVSGFSLGALSTE